MRQETRDPHELISALIDGELAGEDFARAMSLLDASADARAHWHACHVAGDVLRAGDLAVAAPGGADFVSRLRHRLQDEAPLRQPVTSVSPQTVSVVPAANDARRWKHVAGFASMAALVAITWQVFYQTGKADVDARLARQDSAVAVAVSAPAPTMIRDPRLDQFLAAHQQLGGASALQMPAGFLRNATFEQPAP
jgi:sigma-E factor negative regulatory protein RseA